MYLPLVNIVSFFADKLNTLLLLFGMSGGQDKPAKPRISLPSFRDVRRFDFCCIQLRESMRCRISNMHTGSMGQRRSQPGIFSCRFKQLRRHGRQRTQFRAEEMQVKAPQGTPQET